MSLQVLVRRIPPESPAHYDYLFARRNRSVFGIGTALKISAEGLGRIDSLAKKWQQVCENAVIEDRVGLKSITLTAFTSITFSERSLHQSVLVIPKRTVICEADQFFEVLVDAEDGSQNGTKSKPSQFESGAASAQRFLESVTSAISEIHRTSLEKVVLSRDLVMKLDNEPDLIEPLHRLRTRYPDCWTYKVDSVFGASPELLIRADSGEVSARVLAGTAGRGTDPDVDRAISSGLAHSNKNIHEHSFAVRSMVQELEPFCEWVEADSEPFSLALPDLWHLATDVKGRLKPDVTLLDVVGKLHPTAAVAGTPRELAMDFITKTEKHDRGGYAGPVGWLAADGSGELAIALRGGVVEQTESGYQIRALAGCGIVGESDPDAELAETELKFRAVRHAFDC